MIPLLHTLLEAPDWAATRQILETHAGTLLTPAAEAQLAAWHTEALAVGDATRAEVLEVHRVLLQACRAQGLEAAFAALTAPEPEPLDAVAEAFVQKCVNAIGGTTRQKQRGFGELQRLAIQNPPLVPLIAVVQEAVLGRAPAQIEHTLTGELAELWEHICARLPQPHPRAGNP